jgi:hypothetical protein
MRVFLFRLQTSFEVVTNEGNFWPVGGEELAILVGQAELKEIVSAQVSEMLDQFCPFFEICLG